MSAYSSLDRKQAIDQLLQGPKYPEREFVRGGATFAEVYAMAAWLRTALAGPEYRGAAVCLVAEDKAVIAAALLASLAGGPTLLLPYAFSTKALARMQQLTGFTAVISDGPRPWPEGVRVICPQLPGSQAAGTVSLPMSEELTPSDELLKIFTGGSTGTPQLWTKTGENIFGESFFLAERFKVTERDRIMATIPPYHIYGLLFSVALPLVSSALVVGETPSFPHEIAETARAHQVTLLASVPAHYRALREVKKNISLRLAFSSAGMLDADDNTAFYRRHKVGVVEVYGSTETGGIATRNRFLGEEFFTPFPTLEWRIVEERLAIRSPYISPDLPLDTGGFFTSSDRVQACGMNAFALKGRADAVTKVGGKRVDLEEIRALIKQVSGVADCAVMALAESGGREHQIGVLIERKEFGAGGEGGGEIGAEIDVDIDAGIDTELIRKTLVDALEPYALPRRMKIVERIPMKENGKYDWPAIGRILRT